MAIAHVSNGTAGVGTTGIAALAYPASTTAGNLLTMYIASKYPPNGPTKPTGWELPADNQGTGGVGAAGADSGEMYSTVYYRISDGTEGGGTIALTATSGNSITARMAQYSKAGGTVWDLACTYGGDVTAGTDISVTGVGVLDITTNDLVQVSFATNTDLNVHTLETLTVPGCTFGVFSERNDSSTGQGDDCGLVMCTYPCTGGPASGVPVWAATSSATTGNNPAGAAVFLRMREVTPVTTTSSGTAAGTSGATGVGKSTARSSGTAEGSSSASGEGTFVGAPPAESTTVVLGHTLLQSGLLRRGLFSGRIL